MSKKIIFSTIIVILFFGLSSPAKATVWPLSGSVTPDTIDSDYGPRNLSGEVDFHYGLDLRAASATPVKSIKADTIKSITLAPTGSAGNYVEMASGLRYLHLSTKYNNIEFTTDEKGNLVIKIDSKEIRVGDTLTQGETFAYSGNSGEYTKKDGTTGTYPYHLHIDKGQFGSNPLRDLPYAFSPSTISIIKPTSTTVKAGKVPIILEVKSGQDDYDLNEVVISYKWCRELSSHYR